MFTSSHYKYYAHQNNTNINQLPYINRPIIKPQLRQMDSWQAETVNSIINTPNKVIIVNAMPAAGKTMPIIKAMAHILSDVNTKILYSTPIQFLATKLSEDLLIDLEKEIPNIPITVGLNIGNINTTSNTTRLDVATYELAAKLSQTKQYNMIIIDEFQEAMPLRTDSDLFNKADSYAKIISNGILKADKLIILTGSLNRSVIDDLSKFITTNYKVGVSIHPTRIQLETKQIRNRSLIKLNPTNDILNTNNLIDNLVNKVVSKISGNLLVLFSKNRINLIIEKMIQKIPSLYSINDLINSTKYKNNILISPPPANQNVNIDVMNPKLINCLERGFAYIIGGTHLSPSGLILRDIDRELNQTIVEKQIIGELFVNKKTFVALATDSIGLGVTLDIQNLYIPSIKKFDGSKMTNVDMSSLIQILNRAGRGKYPIAQIYCAEKDYDHIYKILSADPVLDVDVADSTTLKGQLVKYSKLDLVNKLKSLIQNL